MTVLRSTKRLGLLIVAILFAVTTQAIEKSDKAESNKNKVYVYTDENGTEVFTDQLRPGAKLVNMNHNTLLMPATNTDIFKVASGPTQQIEYKVAVTRPTTEQTIRDNNGVVQVSGRITPHLGQGHKFRLKLDGQIRQKPHSNAHFVLRDVDRGEHNVVLELLNANDEVVTTSEPVTFYMFRASILHKKRQN